MAIFIIYIYFFLQKFIFFSFGSSQHMANLVRSPPHEPRELANLPHDPSSRLKQISAVHVSSMKHSWRGLQPSDSAPVKYSQSGSSPYVIDLKSNPP